uniref:Sulfotransferase domain-containing protein n=1 Tax=viral metagenome TaxID=1070528 RepID=A0A6C0FD38_9ZZZZ|tara:strand:+ start:895 stop:1560 length:666 start_codon:yes stop_codon:yes gene_type:complete
MENILLSYPRSGNHLVRFFIELLSEKPTFGCKLSPQDIEIYKNKFSENIPFNISNSENKGGCYFKFHGHEDNIENIKINNLILIIRNPKEVLLRHNNFSMNIKNFDMYFKDIDIYDNHKGKKLLLYYEDILTDKVTFINTLYDFLEINNTDKKAYTIENINKLFNLSLNPNKGCRAWGGNNSNGNLDFYYKKIPQSMKPEFDRYLNEKLENYQFLKEKYNL